MTWAFGPLFPLFVILFAASLAGLENWGIVVDAGRNEGGGRGARVISPDDARVAVCVVPTDEEHAKFVDAFVRRGGAPWESREGCRA